MLQKLVSAVLAYVLSGVAMLREGYESLKTKILRVAHGDKVYLDAGTFGMYTPQLPGSMQADDRGQLGFQTVIAAATVVVAVMVVIIIVDRFETALGDPNSAELGNASDSVISGFASMADLIGPLLIVAIAVVVISLIRRVQDS
jgi:hypothetical protein